MDVGVLCKRASPRPASRALSSERRPSAGLAAATSAKSLRQCHAHILAGLDCVLMSQNEEGNHGGGRFWPGCVNPALPGAKLSH